MLDTKDLHLTEPRKMADRFVGPYEITAQIGPTAYRLNLPDNQKIHNVFHVGLLKPYVQGYNTLPSPQPQPIIIDGQVEWEIEGIRKHRMVRGQQKSFVSW